MHKETKIENKSIFKDENNGYLIYSWSDKALHGYSCKLNMAHYNGELLEIMSITPFSGFKNSLSIQFNGNFLNLEKTDIYF